MDNQFYNFPTICVDNFYKNPDKVREFALSLDYDNMDNLTGYYPGKRTQLLHKVDSDFFDKFCEKLFSIYYDFLSPVKWEISTSFQLIYPMADNPYDGRNIGWIHKDYETLFGGIIYLTPDINPNCGTSIFRQSKEIDIDLVNKVNQEKVNFYTKGNAEEHNKSLSVNNSFFTETARFDNIYNRLVSFDGECFHGANNFYSETQPRLTQAFFVKTLTSNSKLPLERGYDIDL
jgi:hypothetical protein